MGRTNYWHGALVLVFLVSLALVGWPVLEFLVMFVVTVSIGAALLYAFLGFMYGMSRVIEFFYEER